MTPGMRGALGAAGGKLMRDYAQGSRETVPGKTTGHMPEMLDAPYAVRQNYDNEVAKLLYDAQGRDRIALGSGSSASGHIQGPGVFEGGVNPGRQTLTVTDSVPCGATRFMGGHPTV